MSNRFTRRSQSVVPFGVGSIVELEDDAVMAAGLESWPREAEQIRDERLATRLGVEYFRVPPPKPDSNGIPGRMAPMPYVRFPQWHFCPRCRFLTKADLYAQKPPRCGNQETSKWLQGKPACGALPEKKRPYVSPLRFVSVCEAGHIEDFPWNSWAHSDRNSALNRKEGCDPPSLYFYPTRRSGLSGLMVLCSKCGKKRSLMGSTNPSGLKGFECMGVRPWLGAESRELCSAVNANGAPARMLALQRGASNLYFAEVASSIMIPPFSNKVHRVLREPRVWNMLEEEKEKCGSIPDEFFRAIARMHDVDVNQLREAYESRLRSDDVRSGEVDETRFRFAEYKALQQERRDQDDLLSCRPQPISSYHSSLSDSFASITLVERLAETRALTSFTRINPASISKSRLSLGDVPWLPAFRVYGEGIFLRFRDDRLEEKAPNWQSRVELFHARAARSRRPALLLSGEMIFIHTFSHCLIKRMSYEAGYGASSIRERIYSAPPGHPHQMSGLMLYTAAGDADGTLGGLVGLGRAGTLESIITAALEEARWCSSDPICIESKGQGPDSLNLAACHACCLLPETSCELQNRFLDRSFVHSMFSD